MIKTLLIWIGLLLVLTGNAQPRTYTDAEGRAAWATLKRQPIAEKTFREACDLMQAIGRTHINLSYELLAEYVPRVQKTGNRHWVHILLMGWAKAKESLNFFDEAEVLFQKARQNARPDPALWRETLTCTTLLYSEWGKQDSLEAYLRLSEQVDRAANDRENLAFILIFKALSLFGPGRMDSMRTNLEEAIRLASGLRDKNALFMARYNYTLHYLGNPQQQITELESLLELAKDTSLNHRPRLYERSNFYFRDGTISVLYNLVQINMLLTDYENAGKFADMFYEASIRRSPNGRPYYDAEMAIIKVYQRQFSVARAYVDSSRQRFGLAESQIPYPNYFVAAGLLAEQDGRFGQAVRYYQTGQQKGESRSFALPIQMHYAHALTRVGQLDQAQQVLSRFKPAMEYRSYSATGLYYYQFLADLLKARGDIPAYSRALETYYSIKDSLTNLNQYRAIQEILAKVRIRDKEQQILRLNEESLARDRQIRRERLFYGGLIGLATLTIIFLVLYLRNRQIRSRQKEALQQSQLEQMEKQRHIDLMRGVMDAEENERRKIADQLHDEVNAMLALASLNISSTIEKGRQDEQGEKKLYKAREALSTVSTTIRELSHRLTPLMIEKFGFAKAIDDLAETINLSEKLHLETIVVGFEDTQKYSLTFMNDLYRIIQELVQNILKHAQATQAMLEIVEHDRQITIMVDDNGVGISDSSALDGQGLSTIRSRVAYLDGELEIRRKEEGGTLVVIELTV